MQWLWNLIFDRYRVLVDQWKQCESVQSRACENYTKACAVLEVILPDPDRASRFRELLNRRVQRNEETNIMAQMVRLLPYLIKAKKFRIPCRIDTTTRQLAVQASFLVNAYYNHERDQNKLKPDELIRLGKDESLLKSLHHDKPMKARIEEQTERGPQTIQQRCFIFDSENPIVAEVVEQLAGDAE
jgi:hypothetical protein